MSGHYSRVESKTVDKRWKKTKKYATTSKFFEFLLSATQKHMLEQTVMTPEFNLKVLQGCMLQQLQLSLPMCSQCLFTCTCLCSVLLQAPASLHLFSPHIRPSSLNPSQLYSLSHSGSPSPLVLPFSVLRPFITCLLVWLLLFPVTSTLPLPFHPTFHSPKTQNTGQILSLPFCTDIETGIRTAHFSA